MYYILLHKDFVSEYIFQNIFLKNDLYLYEKYVIEAFLSHENILKQLYTN